MIEPALKWISISVGPSQKMDAKHLTNSRTSTRKCASNEELVDGECKMMYELEKYDDDYDEEEEDGKR